MSLHCRECPNFRIPKTKALKRHVSSYYHQSKIYYILHSWAFDVRAEKILWICLAGKEDGWFWQNSDSLYNPVKMLVREIKSLEIKQNTLSVCYMRSVRSFKSKVIVSIHHGSKDGDSSFMFLLYWVQVCKKVKISLLLRENWKLFRKIFPELNLWKIYLPVKRNVVTLPKFELEFYLTKAEFTARYKKCIWNSECHIYVDFILKSLWGYFSWQNAF